MKRFKIAFSLVFYAVMLCSVHAIHAEEKTEKSVPAPLNAAANEPKSAQTFELKSGEKITGEIVFESSLYYRLKLDDGSEKIVFKKDLAANAAPPPKMIEINFSDVPPQTKTLTTGNPPTKSIQSSFSERRQQRDERKNEFVKQMLNKGPVGVLILVISVIVGFLIQLCVGTLFTKITLSIIKAPTTWVEAFVFQWKQLFFLLIFAIITAVIMFPAIAVLGVISVFVLAPLAFVVAMVMYTQMLMAHFELRVGQAILFIVVGVILSVLVKLILTIPAALLTNVFRRA